LLAIEVLISSDPNELSPELVNALVELTLEIFTERKDIFDEGFILLSGLCAWTENKFD